MELQLLEENPVENLCKPVDFLSTAGDLAPYLID